MSQTLGKKSWYEYESDDGTAYSVLMDDTLAAAAGFTLNDGAPQLPRRFSMRVIHCEAIDSGRKVRKALPCPQVTAALYSRSTGGTVSIGGNLWAITGRRGETVTFAANRQAADPVDDDPVLDETA